MVMKGGPRGLLLVAIGEAEAFFVLGLKRSWRLCLEAKSSIWRGLNAVTYRGYPSGWVKYAGGLGLAGLFAISMVVRDGGDVPIRGA